MAMGHADYTDKLTAKLKESSKGGVKFGSKATAKNKNSIV